MRRLLVLCGLLALTSATASADSIQLANIWATFASTQPCQADCTLTVGINFEFYTTSPQLIQGGWLVFGDLIPGTLRINSWGAGMEPYSYYGGGPSFKEYMTFFNRAGDEMDIDTGSLSPGRLFNQPLLNGVDTISLYMWACASQACRDHFGAGFIGPTTERSVVVEVPEANSWAMLFAAAGVLGFSVWRWRLPSLPAKSPDV